MSAIRAVTVYCSSSDDVAPIYFDAARELGASIARERWTVVYGGNALGCMRALANGARSAGGKVTGVTPRLWVDDGTADTKCDELVVTDGMRQRKALMEERGDAFITLPGGLGTLEELFEILVGRVLGYHAKPIVLLNLAGFYDPLLRMIHDGIDQKFIRAKSLRHFHISPNVADAIEALRRFPTPPPPELDTAEPSARE